MRLPNCQVRLQDMQRVGALTLDVGEDYALTSVVQGDFGYFGTSGPPGEMQGRIVKVNLDDMRRVTALLLPPNQWVVTYLLMYSGYML